MSTSLSAARLSYAWLVAGVRCRPVMLDRPRTGRTSRWLGVNGGRDRTCPRPANWLEVALGVTHQCTATIFIRSYDDSGIGPQGAAGLLGLHRSSRSIPALRYSAKSHERNMNMRGAAKIGKGLTNR